MSISLIKSLTSVCTRNTLSVTVPCCIRCFSDTPVKKASKSTVKPPSSRKIARDNRKKLLQQEVEQYKKLDEIALKSGFPAPWKYYAAAIIDREPQVLPPLEDWQQKMQDIWEERYNANAKKVEPFLNMLKPIEEKKVDENDIVEEEIPVSYETEDDKNKVMTSLNRSLTRYLYLVVNRPTKHVLGSGWSFPMIEYNKEEHPTMRDAAEDVATAAVGKHMKLYFLGNAPVGYIARKYSKEDQQKYKAFGYKVFYHRALITEGDLMLNPREGREYAFVTADELDQYLDKETTEYLKRILD